MHGGFDQGQAVADILAAPDVARRWAALTRHLAMLGIDQINYGLLDTRAAALVDAPARWLTTMDAGWIAYYSDRRLDLDDPHVSRVRAGNVLPYHWSVEQSRELADPAARAAAMLTAEAGLRAQTHVTLVDPFGAGLPIGGLTLGSSQRSEAHFAAITGLEGALVTLAHLFHQRSIGEARRRMAGVAALTPRERDCLSLIATGRRPAEIAARLALARVTVDLHLRNARGKLGAATLAEAVAKAIVYDEVAPF